VTFHFSGKVTTSEEAVLKRLQAVLKRSDIRPIPQGDRILNFQQ